MSSRKQSNKKKKQRNAYQNEAGNELTNTQ